MLNLVIDIGNTFTKVAVFENDDLLESRAIPATGSKDIDSFLSIYKINRVILSSVKTEKQPWQTLLEESLGYIF
jgi:type III pantothenate kinase